MSPNNLPQIRGDGGRGRWWASRATPSTPPWASEASIRLRPSGRKQRRRRVREGEWSEEYLNLPEQVLLVAVGVVEGCREERPGSYEWWRSLEGGGVRAGGAFERRGGLCGRLLPLLSWWREEEKLVGLICACAFGLSEQNVKIHCIISAKRYMRQIRTNQQPVQH
jgi:hypothetical protein